jgi:hypothetical protein
MRTYLSYSSSLVLLTLSITALAADASRSVADCQSISDRAARFACYDQAEALPKATVPRGATQSTISAQRSAPPTTQPAASASTANAAAGASNTANAAVTTAPEKKSLLKRMLPFGLGDDEDDAEDNKSIAIQPTKEAAPASADSVAGFGLTSASTNNSAKVESNDEGTLELTDTISSLKTSDQLLWEVTLASGQVWRQMYTQRYAMSVGDKVRITSTRWGKAYRLYDENSGGFMQVARVK